MQGIPIIVDGPNYINRVIELGIKPNHIARQLSLESLREIINKKLADFDVKEKAEIVEFVCSKKKFGPRSQRFSEKEQELLLKRLKAEIGVYVDIVDLPGSSEKGVDTTISSKIEDYAKEVEILILLSSDRDFVPILKKLRGKVKVFLVSLKNDYPIELRNEAYATIFLDYRDLFKYHYPEFHINDFTKEKCAELFSEADDRILNQLRIDWDGFVFISKKVGAMELENIKVRWETFGRYNEYVGPKAASDDKYIEYQFKQIKLCWERNASGYIDMPVEILFPDEMKKSQRQS
ncbi:NYN domain-containing protein [Thermosulfurimonas dismutans]|uniref:NYN domain-containing protein n=1 Tax=Thermosulfurimonas dismutans TaxID=999894 RepID=A0A179D1T7_9BACT|nr:NYN domain-containing protein [Thermosulfurimonas dismutans]OAQ20034.1 hypothetical protein TDIS_1853 [Thermosulfurimonas dismutans]